MEVRFGEPMLALIETGQAAETKLPVGVIATARRRLAVLRAAPDFETLQNWRSFGLSDEAVFPGECVIKVGNDWEMMISFEQEGRPVSVVLSVRESFLDVKKGRAVQ
ncbi:MAG: hypothetical protein AAGJ50_13875 [Pseudomonadota bacterium]